MCLLPSLPGIAGLSITHCSTTNERMTMTAIPTTDHGIAQIAAHARVPGSCQRTALPNLAREPARLLCSAKRVGGRLPYHFLSGIASPDRRFQCTCWATIPLIAEESAVLDALPGNAHIVAVAVLRWVVNARDMCVFARCWMLSHTNLTSWLAYRQHSGEYRADSHWQSPAPPSVA